MVQIYEDQPSFGSQLMKSTMNAQSAVAQALMGEYAKKKEQEKKTQGFEEFTGMKGKGLSPESMDKIMQEMGKYKAAEAFIKSRSGGNRNPQSMGDALQGGNEPMQPSEQSEEEQMLMDQLFPNIGKGQREREELELKKAEPERKKVQEVLDRVSTSRENLLQRRADYRIAEQQIKQAPGKVGNLKNFVAKTWNIPGLADQPAAVFAATMKDAYIQSLKQIPGSRPNQWIEQQIEQATPRVGLSDAANQSLLDVGNFKLDMEEHYNDLIDALAEKYRSQNKPIPSSITNEAYKLLKPYVDERQKELAYDLRENYEKDIGLQDMEKLKHVPQGTPLTTEMAQIFLSKTDGDQKKALKLAESLGFEIPSKSFFEKRGYKSAQ